MSIISRLTNWTTGQILTAAALNAEFSNITNLLNNLDAATTTWTNVKTTTLTPTNVGPFTATGAIAMGTNKITGLGNGSAAQDAAAFGQIGGTGATNAAGYIIGTVVQIIQVTSGTQSVSSGTGATVTLSTSAITPKATTHKIRITACSSFSNGTGTGIVSLFKNGSVITGVQERFSVASAEQGCTLFYVDSPATVSATTYAIYITSPAGTAAWGDGANFLQMLTLEEIAA